MTRPAFAYALLLATVFACGIATGRSIAAREAACVAACDDDAACVKGCVR